MVRAIHEGVCTKNDALKILEHEWNTTGMKEEDEMLLGLAAVTITSFHANMIANHTPLGFDIHVWTPGSILVDIEFISKAEDGTIMMMYLHYPPTSWTPLLDGYGHPRLAGYRIAKETIEEPGDQIMICNMSNNGVFKVVEPIKVMDRTRKTFIRLADGVRSGAYVPRRNRLCQDCPYRTPCEAVR